MAYIQDVFPIVQKKNLAKNIFDLTISCPQIATEAVPGQFVHRISTLGSTVRLSPAILQPAILM